MSEDCGLKEKLMTMRDFIMRFLTLSCKTIVWPLELSESKDNLIAYLAQHNLFDQIPALLNDVDQSPSLCGVTGPSMINVWLGTGGTRTPLHFDTYDNLFVQIVGSKYVRLYESTEVDKIYVLKESDHHYGKQGNMSSLNCEREDYDKHPLAKDAIFTETLMLPGDCLFIPKRTWHYFRSLSTSISINYWW